jgi:hypothetical protein
MSFSRGDPTQGICNTLLFSLPWQSTHRVFRDIGAAFLALDMLICALFTAITVSRYIIWPEIVPVMLSNETHSLFLGVCASVELPRCRV